MSSAHKNINIHASAHKKLFEEEANAKVNLKYRKTTHFVVRILS